MYPKALDIYPKPLDRDFPAGKIIFIGWRGKFSRPGKFPPPADKNNFSGRKNYFYRLAGEIFPAGKISPASR
ncbi:hypothetical protein [Porphyromonas gingivalis]|uniref:hypothetical protein n=1 Tax=Porphyromonas gingivalis TaxID=837 RepID=UPI000B70319C|nr:hypothetical protein [Porphyromonas gingivalis]OWR76474.1 hypothetical protein SJDPG11_02240 [Porphyromonas gingivalis SJD11]